jgi:hypothetical protein
MDALEADMNRPFINLYIYMLCSEPIRFDTTTGRWRFGRDISVYHEEAVILDRYAIKGR